MFLVKKIGSFLSKLAYIAKNKHTPASISKFVWNHMTSYGRWEWWMKKLIPLKDIIS
jgi:hypothetical protein